MTESNQPVLAIFGPTGSGKSAVAEAVADRIPAEIVSADSMQVYRGLPILTNQPARPTRLVAIWELDYEASVGEYAKLAQHAVDEALTEGITPLVVGGTGLYLRAALVDLDLPPAPSLGARPRFEELYDSLGPEGAHALLVERDPRAAETVHANDRRRVVRALELAAAGESLAQSPSRLWTRETRHPTLVFGLDVPREVLAARIEARTRAMFEHGVEEEAARAAAGPLSSTAAQVIGLREITELPREEAVAAIVRRTLQYAAYQRKWMRRIPGVVPLAAERAPAEVAKALLVAARARFTFLGSKKKVPPASEKVGPITPGTPFDSFGLHAKGPADR
jgi:tRNA dimethylallyltransferase